MEKIKRIALVAHDNTKRELIEWVEWNWNALRHHKLVCTGTTGRLVEEALKERMHREKLEDVSVEIRKLNSGPLGGDQQLGALICDGYIDAVIFFWDPMQPQPHEVDIKALLRITVLYNIPTACNRATADHLISSELFNHEYTPKPRDFSEYLNRKIKL